ncbi:MAG TPA: hypothetical protein VFU19_15245 [Iamia sp.]|nr:hypothetical protein [Iamia sp.]
MRRGRAGLSGALVVATVALTSCVGIGAVDRGRVTAEAQQRGGGVTTALVDEAIAAVAAETGADPLVVHAVTATLARVTVVVPAADGAGREAWTYGTSGLYGGRGLEGPDRPDEPGGEPFPVAVGDLDVDGATAAARAAAGPGLWVASVTIGRPATGGEPATTVAVDDGSGPTPVVIDADGAVVPEGPR